ncbi:ImmA/IrrE family metallo-endopeptidase [Clostridium magnum]|uniref:IrrE N-terminal-like domain-containing protein n=1 Tax=Clostridium magnum DSM 2767 TaxID=1121326 RepID=A0A162UV96_9CLOT|nr:ImmA/IrrE family metallo-endopeptidase [Clostridium magnum]KZL94323.1 hypothetical protein CLMAG_13760 [Clostridium magnum DSM 2767]SHJ55031.1 protein of unknown function [Clostridium magnum DSM 2767]
MRQNEIIELARGIRKKFNTINTFEICEKLDIPISFTKLKPNIYPAYTIQVGEKPVINLNVHFTVESQLVLCAHELGHVLMHSDKIINQFNDNHNGNYEYEANLFAVALLFNQDSICIDMREMDNYMLKNLLDYNIHLKM